MQRDTGHSHGKQFICLKWLKVYWPTSDHNSEASCT